MPQCLTVSNKRKTGNAVLKVFSATFIRVIKWLMPLNSAQYTFKVQSFE